MKKILIILMLIVFNARSEHNWYLDAGKNGIGIGYELRHKLILFHCGSHNMIEYDNYTIPIRNINGSIYHQKNIRCYFDAVPYVGLGANYNINKSITLQAYFDLLMKFKIGYESIYYEDTLSNLSAGPGFNLDMQTGTFRIGIGGIYNNWKLPIGLLIDTYLNDDFYGSSGLRITPRLVIYF
jgi:hypothetical protein